MGQPNSHLANEFIEAKLGWSFFEAKETLGKVPFLPRVREMPDSRWPKMILNMIIMCKLNTLFMKREKELRFRFECSDVERELDEKEKLDSVTFHQALRKHMRSKLDEEWRDSMKDKSSLETYRSFKKDRGVTEHFYDNSRGSMLLASGRAGFLKTKVFKVRLEKNSSVLCAKCLRKPETLRHVIMECNDDDDCEEEVQRRLGLHESSSRKMVATTKAILTQWEKNISYL